MLTQAGTEAEKASVHYLLALALQDEGISNKKEKCFSDSCDEFKTALELEPRLALAHYGYGVRWLICIRTTRARGVAAFLAQDKKSSDLHDRAQRYMQRIELARAKMAPPFR